jgi:hypothetical protein
MRRESQMQMQSKKSRERRAWVQIDGVTLEHVRETLQGIFMGCEKLLGLTGYRQV